MIEITATLVLVKTDLLVSTPKEIITAIVLQDGEEGTAPIQELPAIHLLATTVTF